ncbi:hypothetical protein BJ546DRAFT_228563 [Cryomyces antarcticus]
MDGWMEVRYPKCNERLMSARSISGRVQQPLESARRMTHASDLPSRTLRPVEVLAFAFAFASALRYIHTYTQKVSHRTPAMETGPQPGCRSSRAVRHVGRATPKAHECAKVSSECRGSRRAIGLGYGCWSPVLRVLLSQSPRSFRSCRESHQIVGRESVIFVVVCGVYVTFVVNRDESCR